ncbi:hypothetical protein ZIOFF_065923 [Zingiber officinale]|uniref:Pectinesterase inhibitor domain-containing protein n=1 Tax=Zingiber officinale TaxID=94328 RepID=A0A8J5EXV7_ZINOF|nr:hypothetical protein ZIOFF_065923 [Zingiber officinale]
MPSFLDFSDLSKSNCIERAQRDKRLMIVVDSVSVILIVAIYTAATVVYNSNSTMGFQVFNTVQVLCSSTDNHTICESNLKDAVNSTFTPKDLLCATIAVIVDEVGKAFQHSDAIGSAVVQELKNWLSATATYQETCINGFPDWEQKNKMHAAMTTTKLLTYNALAIVNNLSSFLSLIKIDGGRGSRRLLTKDQRLIREEAFPNWHHDGDVRRFLLGCAAKQLIPNVMVAKDDIGDFKTFSEVRGKISSYYDDR